MSNFRSYGTDKMPQVVKTLIIINVVVWIAQLILDPRIGLTYHLALFPIGSPDFKAYQVLTHMFTHASYDEGGRVQFYHILFNMFALWMFGRTLENVWGGKRFLEFYMMCGIGAAVFHLLVQQLTGGYSYAVGASGAVMGIFAAFAYLNPNSELYLMFIPIPIKAKWAMLGLMAFDIFGGIAGTDGIAHFAHLGGAITGIIMVLIWNRNRSRFY
jgi:membrane associated rhomboid family serine protease